LATKIVARNQAKKRIWWATNYLTGLPLDAQARALAHIGMHQALVLYLPTTL
jgi:hypothetical protein